MDDADIKQRVIGLLTLAYNTDWDPETGDNIEAVTDAAVSLLEEQNAVSIISELVVIFVELCGEVRMLHPGVNIDEFLQRMGLQAYDNGADEGD
jgi:hypothetical protein